VEDSAALVGVASEVVELLAASSLWL